MKKKFTFVIIVLFFVIIGTVVVKKQPQVELVVQPSIIEFSPSPVIIEPPVIIPPPEITPQAIFEEAVKSIKSDEIKKHVEYLASDKLEGRKIGTPGCDLAADYIIEQLKSYGLKTELHKFTIYGKTTANVYGWIPGEIDEIIVVGAHYDHIGKGRRGIYNGADDNASGTSAVLAIAKAFSLIKGMKRTIVFQLYSAEERGLQGSRFYCKYPTFPKNKPDIKSHVLMVNLDMIGYLNKDYLPRLDYDPSSFELIPELDNNNQIDGYHYTFLSHDSAPDLAGVIDELSEKYSFVKSVTNRGGGGSDQTSFYNKGVPVVFLHTGLHRNFHRVTDTAEKLNYTGIEGISKYTFELVYQMGKSEAVPKFNRKGFNVLPYTHDHMTSPFSDN